MESKRQQSERETMVMIGAPFASNNETRYSLRDAPGTCPEEHHLAKRKRSFTREGKHTREKLFLMKAKTVTLL